MTPDPIALAIEHFRAGRYNESAEICVGILAGNADNPEINHLLGFIRFNQGKSADGIAMLKSAVSAPNATAEMHNNYGALLNQLGRTDEAIAAFNRALALKPNYVDALNNLGIVYREATTPDAAIAPFKRAVELTPALPHIKANLRSAYRDVVPAWHFAMMDDKRRNTAYRAAIARAVPGKRVLEIGTGAGLLAMMAARAGASTVTTCERVGLIADRARDIVALNGLATRVKGIGKSSIDLELLRLDFREKSFPMAKRPMRVTATKPGLCVGVAQWIRIELDRETSYDNRPAPNAEHSGHWTHMLHRFPKLLRLQAGDVVAIDVSPGPRQGDIGLAA